MKAYLTKRYWFSASHRLHSESMTDRENQAVYGKCNNPHGHGHNYALEVTVAGPVDPKTGMVCNLADLDDFVNSKILERFGHENQDRPGCRPFPFWDRSEEHTSELQSHLNLVCRLLLEKKNKTK